MFQYESYIFLASNLHLHKFIVDISVVVAQVSLPTRLYQTKTDGRVVDKPSQLSGSLLLSPIYIPHINN